jgi:hypothetical protein
LHIAIRGGISVYPALPGEKQAMEDCMVRRQIASRIVVVGGLVCANVSGLFVEARLLAIMESAHAGLQRQSNLRSSHFQTDLSNAGFDRSHTH